MSERADGLDVFLWVENPSHLSCVSGNSSLIWPHPPPPESGSHRSRRIQFQSTFFCLRWDYEMDGLQLMLLQVLIFLRRALGQSTKFGGRAWKFWAVRCWCFKGVVESHAFPRGGWMTRKIWGKSPGPGYLHGFKIRPKSYEWLGLPADFNYFSGKWSSY